MKKPLLLLSIVCVLSLSFTTVDGAEWVYYASSKALEDQYYYDDTSIFTDSEGAKRVWIKQVFSSKGKPHFIETMKQNGFSDNKKLDKISFVLNYLAIKCSEKQYNLISYYVRDSQGNNIDSGKPEPAWSPIKSGNIIEILHKKLCR